jgi:hypothetical protein
MTPADIVAIRQGEEAFARWRASLERAMERVHRLDPMTLNRESEERRLLEQELLEERQALEAEISKSAVLSQAKRALKDFSVGGLVTIALIPLAGPVAPLLGGAGKAAGGLLLDYFAGRTTLGRARALHRQYLLFSTAS